MKQFHNLLDDDFDPDLDATEQEVTGFIAYLGQVCSGYVPPSRQWARQQLEYVMAWQWLKKVGNG